MTKEELLMVFKWLELNANKNNLFYFKYDDKNQISAYFNDTNKRFAQFYTNQILKVIELEKQKNNKFLKFIDKLEGVDNENN